MRSATACGDIPLGHQPEVDEHLAQPSTVGRCGELGVEGDLQVEGGQPAARHEHGTEAPSLVVVGAVRRERQRVERRGIVRGSMAGRLQGHPWCLGTHAARLHAAGG